MRDQFSPDHIMTDAEVASAKNHAPGATTHNRFGIELFVSKDLLHLDPVRDGVKTGILIPPEGDEFIKKHPGILRELDHAIVELEGVDGHPVIGKVAVLKGLGTLQAKGHGGQSNFYILDLNGEKFAVKTHLGKRADIPDKHQPYINEMLQMLSLAEDLKDELSSLGIRFPDFLLASGQVSCTKYYEDTKYHSLLSEDRLLALRTLILGYMEKQMEKQDPLWENVYLDLFFYDENGHYSPPFHNFRIQKDGTLVWIDPFVCYKPEPKIGN